MSVGYVWDMCVCVRGKPDENNKMRVQKQGSEHRSGCI